jgi:hypothetical protein
VARLAVKYPSASREAPAAAATTLSQSFRKACMQYTSGNIFTSVSNPHWFECGSGSRGSRTKIEKNLQLNIFLNKKFPFTYS